MKMVGLFALLVSTLCQTGCLWESCTLEARNAISGEVTDSNGDPAEFDSVYMIKDEERRDCSSSLGRYSCDDRGPGLYVVYFVAAGDVQSYEFTVNPDEDQPDCHVDPVNFNVTVGAL